MKKILLAVMTISIVVSALFLCSSKKTLATTSKLDPSKIGDAIESYHQDEGFYPFPKSEATYMVNHGKGWWYAPYTGAKLDSALAAFEKDHPKFVRDGYLQDVAMRSRYSSPLPLDKYDYDQTKGTFVLYCKYYKN